MRLTIAYSKIKKRNLVLIDNATYQRETLSERPIRQPFSLQSLKTLEGTLVGRYLLSSVDSTLCYLLKIAHFLKCGQTKNAKNG